jgi:hypothetical protein
VDCDDRDDDCDDDDDYDDDDYDDDQSNDDILSSSSNILTSIGCAPRYPNKSTCMILRSS